MKIEDLPSEKYRTLNMSLRDLILLYIGLEIIELYNF
jgi:hypothetical protein